MAPWIGGASAPAGNDVGAGYSSLLAFWLGGASFLEPSFIRVSVQYPLAGVFVAYVNKNVVPNYPVSATTFYPAAGSKISYPVLAGNSYPLVTAKSYLLSGVGTGYSLAGVAIMYPLADVPNPRPILTKPRYPLA